VEWGRDRPDCARGDRGGDEQRWGVLARLLRWPARGPDSLGKRGLQGRIQDVHSAATCARETREEGREGGGQAVSARGQRRLETA
jgi:hypothetical protein